MNASYDNSVAVVVLPAVGGGRLQDRRLQKWLGQSDLVRHPEPPSLLEQVAREIGTQVPADGLAALRLWGQTGERPGTWMTAADPVYLEPQLDHLRLHALGQEQLSADQLRLLFDHLQAVLGDGPRCSFAQVGPCGYLAATDPIATSAQSALSINGRRPDSHLPVTGSDAGHRRLLSEIEMALHDHPVNLERQAAGLQAVNSLWLWGGGIAPEPQTASLPPLFANDALLAGYWASMSAAAGNWPGSISGCLDASDAGFVAVVPELDPEVGLLESALRELRAALRAGRLTALVLLFADGIRADVQRGHRLRIWRRRNTLLEAGPGQRHAQDLR